MDTVRAAFIRWLALEKWREVEDLRATLGFDLGQAKRRMSALESKLDEAIAKQENLF